MFSSGLLIYGGAFSDTAKPPLKGCICFMRPAKLNIALIFK